MKKFVISILTILSLSINFSCEKKGDIIVMRYNETGCSNPWDEDSSDKISFSINDPDYENKVKIYLVQSGISVKRITITNDGPISGCEACFCTTGRRINISIYERDKDSAEKLRFYID
jgi:hypothetical protein